MGAIFTVTKETRLLLLLELFEVPWKRSVKKYNKVISNFLSSGYLVFKTGKREEKRSGLNRLSTRLSAIFRFSHGVTELRGLVLQLKALGKGFQLNEHGH